MKSKYKKSLIIIAVLIIINILTLIHFKLWSMANENEYLGVNTSGCINIIYSDNQDVLMINPKAYSDEDGLMSIPNTITISNYCNSVESVSLYLDVFDDSTINDNKIKININGDSKIDTTLLSDVTRINGNNNILNTFKLLNVDLDTYETKRINLKMWLDHNAALTVDKNKFHAKYYIMSDKENKKENFMETLLKNNTIVDNNGLIKYDNNYYFNGNVSNNYVSFANYLWKIVGVNEDGSIKLIYSDETLESNYNDKSNEEKSVAYDDSKVKEYLDNFYNEKLVDYDKYISTKDYCNDTTSTNTYYRIYYGAYTRNITDSMPSIKCETTDKEYGGVKSYKIGLITLDEAAIAGLSTENNELNYLFDSNDYYTMSPTQYNYRAAVGIIDRYGRLNDCAVNENKEIRPVINLVNSLQVSGDGTLANPYLVIN